MDEVQSNYVDSIVAAIDKAFGEESPGSLLSAVSVAETSLDVITSDMTGLVVDVRKEQAGARSAGDAINEALSEAERELSISDIP